MYSEVCYTCPLDPETKTIAKIYLFKNVKNVETIRTNIIKGIWKCAVIKPSLILDIFQVVVAANRAVVSEKAKTMMTKTVYSEILYNLSLTKNISQSLSKFGIDKDTEMLICFIIENIDEKNSEEIIEQIQGECCPVSELTNFSNLNDIKSLYKVKNIRNDDDYILDTIVNKMVTKSFISH